MSLWSEDGNSSASQEAGLVLVLSVTSHTVLFLYPGLHSCVFGTNSSPSFILILLFIFFLCHPPLLLISLLSVYNVVCYVPLQATLYPTSFLCWVMKTWLPCFPPLRSAPGSSFTRLMGTLVACQLFQPQSCLRNKGRVCCFHSCGQPHPRIRGKWGWTFQVSGKSPLSAKNIGAKSSSHLSVQLKTLFYK